LASSSVGDKESLLHLSVAAHLSSQVFLACNGRETEKAENLAGLGFRIILGTFYSSGSARGARSVWGWRS
jgi:hypothetical protein